MLGGLYLVIHWPWYSTRCVFDLQVNFLKCFFRINERLSAYHWRILTLPPTLIKDWTEVFLHEIVSEENGDDEDHSDEGGGNIREPDLTLEK